MKNLKQEGFTLTPKVGVTCRRQAGFTMVELMVAAVVLIIIFSFVVAGFRGGQSTSQLDVALQEIVSQMSAVRAMSLGGQVIENPDPPPLEIFPAGGYGIKFGGLVNFPSQYILYAASDAEGAYSSGDELSNGINTFHNIEFIQFCGTEEEEVNVDTGPPCENPDWKDLKYAGDSYLEIVFPMSGGVLVNYPSLNKDFNYVGGIIKHQKTGRQAYFYISLASGVIMGDML